VRQGASKIFLQATYIWQMATKWAKWRFCAFLNEGSSKTPQKLFGESSCQRPLAEKVEKNNFFLSSFPIDFFIAFLAVSLHEEPKNTTKM
jgi:hypothetical protein